MVTGPFKVGKIFTRLSSNLDRNGLGVAFEIRSDHLVGRDEFVAVCLRFLVYDSLTLSKLMGLTPFRVPEYIRIV